MTNIITQHIPGYFEGFDPQVAEFDTVEELIEIDWIKSYLDWDEHGPVHFVHNNDSLLITNEDKTWWWCVGHATEGSLDLLPEMEYPE